MNATHLFIKVWSLLVCFLEKTLFPWGLLLGQANFSEFNFDIFIKIWYEMSTFSLFQNSKETFHNFLDQLQK